MLIYLFLFKTSTENSRRNLAMSGNGGNSGRAHPSLAKLRDNLVNGTIDFADIPITDMNAEDIRVNFFKSKNVRRIMKYYIITIYYNNFFILC